MAAALTAVSRVLKLLDETMTSVLKGLSVPTMRSKITPSAAARKCSLILLLTPFKAL